MVKKLGRYAFLVVIIQLFFLVDVAAQKNFAEKHIAVSLRMVGHEVLLNSGDSTSRVLPIQNMGDHYRIDFESAFDFQPEELATTISEVMNRTESAIRYIVEVEACDSKEVVYSFEINNLNHNDIVACASRGQSKDCYSILVTILDESPVSAIKPGDKAKLKESNNTAIWVSVGLVFLFALGFITFKKWPSGKPSVVKLGKYQFDYLNSLLILEEQRTELTSKESDLLQLLHSAINTPVKREAMLHKVWGDEGNYIGRTLDVFISKLRNKLQADPAIKIVNIRGVGYKLVVDR